MADSFFDKPFAITDVETTGLDVRRHEIIEIGLVVVDQKTFQVIDELDLKVQPAHIETAEPGALKVNGYVPEQWTAAVPLAEAMKQYSAKTRDAIFCAWNITFDWQFIEEAFRSTGVRDSLDYRRIDIPSIAWEKMRHKQIAKFRLSGFAEELGIPPEPEVHRAINGARLATDVFRKLLMPQDSLL
ncbi:MAG: 3'-5' exonuclease [Patescibacteria group bacterium]